MEWTVGVGVGRCVRGRGWVCCLTEGDDGYEDLLGGLPTPPRWSKDGPGHGPSPRGNWGYPLGSGGRMGTLYLEKPTARCAAVLEAYDFSTWQTPDTATEERRHCY